MKSITFAFLGFALGVIGLITTCIFDKLDKMEMQQELSAYRQYYTVTERMLFHADTDSVPTLEYNQYLNAVAGVNVYRKDEP